MVLVTKQEAVRSLIRGAMRAAHEKDEVCSLTLAGAAEEAMPKVDDLTIFQIFRSVRAWIHKIPEKEAGDALNAERNWLKHFNPGEKDPMEIDSSEFMIMRAITRYVSAYGLDDLSEEYNAFMGFRFLDIPEP